ncbi:MAG: hypothetical protein QF619_02960 [Candidatus Binatia bacterium]|nr:hypothetical protein [Candidatus Binatia bacterium]
MPIVSPRSVNDAPGLAERYCCHSATATTVQTKPMAHQYRTLMNLHYRCAMRQ